MRMVLRRSAAADTVYCNIPWRPRPHTKGSTSTSHQAATKYLHSSPAGAADAGICERGAEDVGLHWMTKQSLQPTASVVTVWACRSLPEGSTLYCCDATKSTMRQTVAPSGDTRHSAATSGPCIMACHAAGSRMKSCCIKSGVAAADAGALTSLRRSCTLRSPTLAEASQAVPGSGRPSSPRICRLLKSGSLMI